ncbi:helix-turn-helix domain-containing protein [Sphingopyxis sp. NJF-3]
MAVTAFIEEAARAGQSRSSERRKLRLLLKGSKTSGSGIKALVHNISATGLLIESDVDLKPGDGIEIALPHAGATSVSVVWASGSIYGCRFDTPVSTATLSAASLRSVATPDAPAEADEEAAALESFGLRLQRLRLAKGLTQLQVATELGVSEPSISAWEQDKARPKAGRIEALAKLLGVQSSGLLGIEPRETLQSAVTHAKTQIAAAAGISTDRIRITIDL